MSGALKKILAVLARAAIRKYKPLLVGITGSVGKTSTKEAIFAILKKKYRTRTSEKNYNNETGLPLTILGISHYGRNIFKWLSVLVSVIVRVFLRRHEYPEVLVLEYGIDRPGDMDYLLSIARPKIAVVTAIGDLPAHIEFFQDHEELVAEKTKLVAALPTDGTMVLNHDDYTVYDMGEKTKAHVITFGAEEHSDLRITNYELRVTSRSLGISTEGLEVKDEELGDVPKGIIFKIEYDGNVVPVRLDGVMGLASTYAATAAAAVGLVLNLNLIEISEALHEYKPPPGRLRLLKGIKNSFILDDTYNASPESMRVALETLNNIPARRKIAVLGDMLEIGKYAEQAHRAIGNQVAKFVDLLFTVGPRAKFIADEARLNFASQNLNGFDDSLSAGRALDPLIQPGDLILIKGSQAMRMEKAVEEIMAEPQRSSELLVRQDEYWKNK